MRARIAVATATVAVAAVFTNLVGGICGCTTPTFPGGGGGGSFGVTDANVWAIPSDTPDGSCTRSSTPETLASAEAAGRQCNPSDNTGGVLPAAYVAANPGDTVGLNSGTYDAQTFDSSDAKSGTGIECDSIAPGSDLTAGKYPTRVVDYSGCITFEPVLDGSVTLGSTVMEVPYVFINGGTTPSITMTGDIEFGTDSTCSTSHDQVVSGVETHSAFFMRGSHSTIENSDFNLGDAYLRDTVSQFNSSCPPTSNLVYRNTFRNLLQWQTMNQEGSGGANEMHIECIHHRIGTNTIFDSNKFFNCAEYDISVQADGGANINVKIINNVFDEPCSHQGGDAGNNGYRTTGTFTSGSNVITSVADTSNVTVGDGLYSINLPYTNNVLSPPTVPTVVSKTSNTITMSMNATTSRSPATFTFNRGCGENSSLALTGGATFSDPLVAFNSFYNDVDSYDTTPGAITGAISYGNVRMERGSFFCSDATISYIVNASDWPSSGGGYNCGSGSVLGAADYVDAANYDFRLGASSVGLDLVPSDISYGVPGVDILGNARTGTNLDAGAYDSSASAP